MFRPVVERPNSGGVRKLSAAPRYDSNFLVLPRPDIESHFIPATHHRRASKLHRLPRARQQRRRRRQPTLGPIPEDAHSATSTPIFAQHGPMQQSGSSGSSCSPRQSAFEALPSSTAVVDNAASSLSAAARAQAPAMLQMGSTPFEESSSQEFERTSSKRSRQLTISDVWDVLSLPAARSLSTAVQDATSGNLPSLDSSLPPDVEVKLAATDTMPKRQLRRGVRRSGVRKSASCVGLDWGLAPSKRRRAGLHTTECISDLAELPSSPLPAFVSRAARDVRTGLYMPDTAQGYMLRQHVHSTSQRLLGALSSQAENVLRAHHGDRRSTAPAVAQPPSRTASHPGGYFVKGELQPPARDEMLRRSVSLSRNLRVNVGSERFRGSATGETQGIGASMSDSGAHAAYNFH